MNRAVSTGLRGRALLSDAGLNKGTAFTEREREHLELDGLLPIVYTPTVGEACRQFGHIYRRPHGLFMSHGRRERMADQLRAAPDDVDVIVVTDGERILGLGDQGLGGMGIPIGKLSLYTAVGGIDPRRTLPVFLDVGTNNEELLSDPLYLGERHARITGVDYDEFVADFVATVKARYPSVLLQWEDFAQHHATTLLHRHRGEILSFNDDIQGTAAVSLAAIRAALRVTGLALEDSRVVVLGAGSAGAGIAEMLVSAGLARDRLRLVDAGGLLHDRRRDLHGFQRPHARPWAEVSAWADHDNPTGFDTTVANTRPHILVGVSGQPGLFTEPIVRSMLGWTDRPIILPLSNPTSRAEAVPRDLLAWTDGHGIVATGSPFDNVVHDGVEHVISQSNNVYIFPGLGLGALASDASEVTDSMLQAAAAAVATDSPCRPADASAGVLPALGEVPDASRRIALAVARAARDYGVGAQVDDDQLADRVAEMQWAPEYA